MQEGDLYVDRSPRADPECRPIEKAVGNELAELADDPVRAQKA